MHPESYNEMGRAVKHYGIHGRILDVGGVGQNTEDCDLSYSSLFEKGCEVLDFDPKADIVVDSYEWPDIGYFDAVISGQCLEHDGKFWLTLKNMARVCKEGGKIVLIMPSTGHVHRFPVDCYRFFEDCGKAWAEWMSVSLLESKILRDSRKWHDLVLVFEK